MGQFNLDAALKAPFVGRPGLPNSASGFDVSAANNVARTVRNAADSADITFMIPADSSNYTAFPNATGNKFTGPLCDVNGLNRVILNGTPKTIVDGSATSLFDLTVANNSWGSGVILYNVQVFDGTDLQSLTGVVTFATVSKAGTFTSTITEVTANQAKAVSAGTLTLAWTMASGTGKVTVKLQPTGSLTETTYQVVYSVLPLSGTVTIL